MTELDEALTSRLGGPQTESDAALDDDFASRLERAAAESDEDEDSYLLQSTAEEEEDDGSVQLLHVLGHLYSQHGETKRGIVMLLIAARLDPDNVGVWRTIAHAFLLDRDPKRAIAVIERLRQMDDSDHPALDLLEARALWASGRRIEARRSFRDFLARSNQL
jgi:type III secretion protein Y